MTNPIDIIYCYRDREPERVRTSLNSLANQEDQEFHVTFIDYGSEQKKSALVEAICKGFAFCSYYYINSVGKMWNRGDALNQGILLSRGTHLFFSDIDMFFLPGFIALLHRLKVNEKANFFPVGYLSQSNSKKLAGRRPEKLSFKKSADHASGMLLAPRHVLQMINGYNTFYSLWGLEDNDLRHRLVLNQIGVSQVQEVYLLHQYHPPVPEDQSLPEGWIQFMKDHFKAQEREKTNPSGITQSLNIFGRPALQLLTDSTVTYTEICARKLYLRYLLHAAIAKRTSQAFRIRPVLPEKVGLIQTFTTIISSVFKKVGLPIDLRSTYEGQYISKKEILSELYFLIKSASPTIADYYVEEREEAVHFILILR